MCIHVLPACTYVYHMCLSCPLRPEEVTGSPELRMVSSYLVDVGSPARASAFNRWVISPSPKSLFSRPPRILHPAIEKENGLRDKIVKILDFVAQERKLGSNVGNCTQGRKEILTNFIDELHNMTIIMNMISCKDLMMKGFKLTREDHLKCLA